MQMSAKYKVWFFGGGETNDNKFNLFTGTFIAYMNEILGPDFGFIKGIYYSAPAMNVKWALNNAQYPAGLNRKSEVAGKALAQIASESSGEDVSVTLVGSSVGSVSAAQTACYIGSGMAGVSAIRNPVNLVLGSTMISKESLLYKHLIELKSANRLGTVIYDELQDSGDSSVGAGGTTRTEAWGNAFGLLFPYMSTKYSGPSFLNTHPVNGHLHRRRSQQVEKVNDYIRVILIEKELAGLHYRNRAEEFLKNL